MKQLLLLSAFFIFISCSDNGNQPDSGGTGDKNPFKTGGAGAENPLKTGGTGAENPLKQGGTESYFNFNDSVVFQNKKVDYYWSDDSSYAVAECGNLLLFVNRQNEYIKIYRDRSKEAGKDEGEWWLENNQIKLSPPKPNRYVFPDVHVNSNQIGGNTNLERPDKNTSTIERPDKNNTKP